MPQAIAIIGPTGVGKTDISLEIAEKFAGEIISVDSMQIYRHMNIGTAKATFAERARVPHYLIDIVDPDEEYNAANFTRDALIAAKQIHAKGKIPILVGGTGLYIKSLLKGIFDTKPVNHDLRAYLKKELQEKGSAVLYQELVTCDPAAAQKIHPNDHYRILRALEVFKTSGTPRSLHFEKQEYENPFKRVLKIGLTCINRQTLYDRINQRVEMMIKLGLIDEVNTLLEMGYSPDLKPMQSIGYRHMVNHILQKWTLDESLNLMARDTRRYAKRQFTWFNADPEIVWYENNQQDMIINQINNHIN
ncbi:MAG: tRNA (adenosine(37)-N6)-dimethylallyltransferase MiaA [Proteobacteria bacterium]|nr:tRNA (adenosine(37)-N6)-dimethylallyltransferase MiaA [Pseudomonadota bacterium]MBU1709507.1 tRNA (adenosine(37)-N6)-dimethylallyltransferase MiaA [Pseudomonadota bacterium]